MESNRSRREFLKKSSALGIAGLGLTAMASGLERVASLEEMAGDEVASFTLPPLPYEPGALEPHIDQMTMTVHHDKHHRAYVDNLNKACSENKITLTLDQIMAKVSRFPDAVRNNGGGHWNHSFFWNLMGPPKRKDNAPSGKVAEALKSSFGGFDEFKNQFNAAAMKRFGSGWAWLVKTQEGRLVIGSTPNQDNPLMDVAEIKGTPILGVDVWEHAYYLKYQNKRADYLGAWWNVVNWDTVAKNL